MPDPSAQLSLCGTARAEFEANDSYLLIRQWGCLENLEDAKTLQDFVTARMRAHGLRNALWDNRPTDAPPAAVIASMRRYVMQSGVFKKSVILLNSMPLAVEVNVASSRAQVQNRAFVSEAFAIAWLSESDSWPRTDVVVFRFGDRFYSLAAERANRIIRYPRLQQTPTIRGDIAGLTVIDNTAIPVLISPTGEPSADAVPASSIIVYETPGGWIGIPATRVLAVTSVEAPEGPGPGSWNTGFGELIHLEASLD